MSQILQSIVPWYILPLLYILETQYKLLCLVSRIVAWIFEEQGTPCT